MMEESIFLQFLFFMLPRITWLEWIEIVWVPNEILKLGRSRNGYKKLKKSMSFWDRMSRRNYIQLSKVAVGYQRYFVIMTYVFYFFVLVFVVIWVISLFTHNFNELLEPYLVIKCYTVELPMSIFTLFNIGRPEDKRGYEWRFITRYYKEKRERK